MGCEIDYDPQKGCMKLTQPVLIQSLEDEFQIDSGGHIPQTPAVPGQVLGPVIEGIVSIRRTNNVSIESGKLIHLMKWSHPEISYAVREVSKHMKKVNRLHVMALYWVFHHVLATKERGASN